MELLTFVCQDINLRCGSEGYERTPEDGALLAGWRAFVEAERGQRATWQRTVIPFSYWERSQLVLLAHDYMMVSTPICMAVCAYRSLTLWTHSCER